MTKLLGLELEEIEVHVKIPAKFVTLVALVGVSIIGIRNNRIIFGI